MWAHEVIRVFGDKLDNPEDHHNLIEEIKKASFLQFKHNFSMPANGFIFSNLAENQE